LDRNGLSVSTEIACRKLRNLQCSGRILHRLPQEITQCQQGRRTDTGGGSKPRRCKGNPVKWIFYG
jgi:hypothetical protein